jgi:kynurenine formamidase
MIITTQIAKQEYMANFFAAQSIAIAVHFDQAQPNHFGASQAQSHPIKAGDFIGDTNQGGSCNVDVIQMTPHCNGTHTECVGHIVNERSTINQQLTTVLCPATLISIEPKLAEESHDSYRPALEEQDFVITQSQLRQCLDAFDDEFLQAVVIRTLPNSDIKKSVQYGDDCMPAFFTQEAMAYLVERKVQHLLVDFPSVDKMYDQGFMTNHHLFWNVEAGQSTLSSATEMEKSISEMIYVDEAIADGHYLLNLQIAPFELDASPSRPMLIPIKKQNKN